MWKPLLLVWLSCGVLGQSENKTDAKTDVENSSGSHAKKSTVVSENNVKSILQAQTDSKPKIFPSSDDPVVTDDDIEEMVETDGEGKESVSQRKKRTFWPFTSLFGYDYDYPYYPPPPPMIPPRPGFYRPGFGMGPYGPPRPPMFGLGFSLGL